MAKADCPGCLKEQTKGYCPGCLGRMFEGKKVSPDLPISKPEYDRMKMRHGDRVSLPGIRSKHPMKLVDRWLELTDGNGTFLLKPVPNGSFARSAEIPANEHVTMQMARQVFDMRVADCALVFFRDGEPAYLTRRFDRNPDGSKCLQEDFAQLARRTVETHGRSYKYGYSYEGIADLMREHIGPYAIEAERLLETMIFNFLVHNGDAHLKDFSLCPLRGQAISVLTPAYGLINTGLHIQGLKPMALELFKSKIGHERTDTGSEPGPDDFRAFGIKIGIQEGRVEKILAKFMGRFDRMESLVSRSYLSESAKMEYLRMVADRVGKLGGPSRL